MNGELDSLTRKVDSLTRLIALVATKDLRGGEKILLLARAGFDRQWIADVCDTTPDTVSVRLAEAKRKARSTQKVPKLNEVPEA